MSKILNIIYWNANSIRSKLTEFYTFLSDENIDIKCISETFLKSDQRINAHPDYLKYRLDREDRPRGGVMIVIKKLIKHAILPSLHMSLIECLELYIETINGSKIEIFSVYLLVVLT
jgi:exonuclease III